MSLKLSNACDVSEHSPCLEKSQPLIYKGVFMNELLANADFAKKSLFTKVADSGIRFIRNTAMLGTSI